MSQKGPRDIFTSRLRGRFSSNEDRRTGKFLDDDMRHQFDPYVPT